MRIILRRLREVYGYKSLSRQVLRKYLLKLGYKWKKIRPVVSERKGPSAVGNREKFLLQIRENWCRPECERMDEVATDESYINDAIATKHYFWVRVKEQTGFAKPNSWRRINIVAAINRNGWTGVDYQTLCQDLKRSAKVGVFRSGSILYFKVGKDKNDEDYHKNFNRESYIEYFKEQLLPSLERPSIILADRVAYHTTIGKNQFNPKRATKEEIWAFLLEENYEIDPHKPVKELRDMATFHLRGDISTEICYLAAQQGHEVVYTPQYMPEFNPIEEAWRMLKEQVMQRQQVTFEEKLTINLPEGFANVGGERVSPLFDRFRKEVEAAEGGEEREGGKLSQWAKAGGDLGESGDTGDTPSDTAHRGSMVATGGDGRSKGAPIQRYRPPYASYMNGKGNLVIKAKRKKTKRSCKKPVELRLISQQI